MRTTRALAALLVLLAAALAGGCANPDAPIGVRAAASSRSAQNAGEPAAPAAPAPASQAPLRPRPTPEGALAAFALRYVNWSYRSLSAEQRLLAATSVGAARLSELQAASASEADTTIARGHVYNRGALASIARDRLHADGWVVVTREQTGGSDEYAGLRAAYHVTLARVARVAGGWAVSEWLPQS